MIWVRTREGGSFDAVTEYYSQWRCPACPRAVDVSPPLFKLDCRDGHDWCAMLPVGEPTMTEWVEPVPVQPGPNFFDGKALPRASELDPQCSYALDCGGVCCLFPGHAGEHECCGDGPGWPGSCQA